MEYKYGIFVGRFEPPHNGHLKVIERGLEIADQVIVIVGSANAAPSIKNPFSFETRKAMIVGALTEEQARRVIVIGVRDYYYNENAWLSDVQAKTDQYINEGDSVVLLGSYKDSSSYYLRSFPQWDFESPPHSVLNSTDIREILMSKLVRVDWQHKPTNPPDISDALKIVPPNVAEFLEEWIHSVECGELCKEWDYYRKYKAQWSGPYPHTDVTADAVVVCSGHVLVVKRKFAPGKGLWALPGGFVKEKETIKAAGLRELKEETGIRVDKIILESSIENDAIFDHPERSLRGRTITRAFYIKLKDGKLPEVRGGDDAEVAKWLPLWDASKMEDKWFEDHFHILNFFTNA